MTLTAIVGALMALVPRAKPTADTRDKRDIEIERLKRSQRKLLDRIETLELDNQGLERELAAERNLLTHWIGEAARFARDARELRRGQYAGLQQAHYAQQAQLGAELLGEQPLQAYAQYNQQLGAAGHCNCVPSRGQMFDAMISQVDNMVEQLNQLGR